MGGKHSHTQKAESTAKQPSSHYLKNRVCSPDMEKHRTVRLITAPTVGIIRPENTVLDPVEVIKGSFRLEDNSCTISSSLRAHTSSDSGSDTSGHRRSVLRKAYDNIKIAAKNSVADNTSASTVEVANDSSAIEASATLAPSRPAVRFKCRQSSGPTHASNARISQQSSPRSERIAADLALLVTSLGSLILEMFYAWSDNGIRGLIKAWVILIACILDVIWNILMRVGSRTGLVRRFCFVREHHAPC